MVFFNYATMQMAAKIVYYGPGLCGKTTNLHHIYSKTSPQSRGEMVSLETETDRTLFFDLLPIDVGVIGGFKTRLQLYTVPGQVFYNTTRKLVLKGVDGMVFVCDSQLAMVDANVDSFANLRENLAEIGLNLDEIPLVLQLNKRDLPNVADVDTILGALDPERRYEHVESVASAGTGVFETLKLISKLTLRTLRRRMTGEEPVRAPGARPSSFRVREERPAPSQVRTIASQTPIPAVATPPPSTAAQYGAKPAAAATTFATPVTEPIRAMPAEDIEEIEASAALETDRVAAIDRHILADAPVAEAPVAAAPEPQPVVAFIEEAVPELQPEILAVPMETATEPDIDFSQTDKPHKNEPDVKTVKVRSSVDVMAELEALRKRATTAPSKGSKRDILADLESLRPKRDIQRTLHLQVPQDVLPRATNVRVTLSFEDEQQGVIETRDQNVDLGDTSDVQSLSVNLKIDLS
jgi:signal recognition particle receptor subunit beta